MNEKETECYSLVKVVNERGTTQYHRVNHERGLDIDQIRGLANKEINQYWSPLKVKETYSWDSEMECYV